MHNDVFIFYFWFRLYISYILLHREIEFNPLNPKILVQINENNLVCEVVPSLKFQKLSSHINK